MSSKRRNIAAWLLIVAVSLSWYWGQILVWNDGFPALETTFSATQATTPMNTTWPALDPTTATEITQPAGWIDPDRDPSAPTNAYDPEPMPMGTYIPPFLRFLGYFLCFGAALAALAAIFLLRQTQPFFGPDLCFALGALLVLPWNTNGSAFAYISGYTLRLILLLGILRELWGWLRAKCALDWCAAERLGAKCRERLRLVLYCLWILVPLLIPALLYGIISLRRTWPICLTLALTALLGLLCLLRYGKALAHLRAQLQNLSEGQPIEVAPGAFEQEEANLSALQQAQEEAIHAAVTAERFKVELIANVSHDLRTPLTSILGYGELLQKEELSEEGTRQLEQLNLKAGYMRDLVDSLFELTKVSSGVLECKREQLDLIRLLEQTIGLFDDKITAASLQLRRKYCRESVMLTTDGARLHQVFANLLGNAIKYALAGTRVHVEVREDEESVTVRMVNTASYEMDFEPEQILQRFARGDKARTTQGSGLGLAIAQTYTESLDGTFRINIDADQFSAIVTLPKALS